ncbi:MAG: hypothetical protein ACOCUS_05865 [Polyangiales bacterium]
MTEANSPSDLEERRRRLERETERLEQLIESLHRSRQHAPRYLAVGVLAVPAFFVGGVWLALAVLFCALSLSLIVLYLAGVREHEYRSELQDVRNALETLGRRRAWP